MTHVCVEELDISEVYQERRNEKRINIYFKANGQKYMLEMWKYDGRPFIPSTIEHDSNQTCLICRKKQILCDPLKKHVKTLFHRLIEFPSIRLEWLYIEHM